MAKAFLKTLFRILGWFLVIVGVLFTVLQAYLVGLPLLFVGGILLWKTNVKVRGARFPGWTPAPARSLPVDDPWSMYLPEGDLAGSVYVGPVDQDSHTRQHRGLRNRAESDM